jgi:hypothetical protein
VFFAGLLCKRGYGAPAAEECCNPSEARWLFLRSHSRLLHYMVYDLSPIAISIAISTQALMIIAMYRHSLGSVFFFFFFFLWGVLFWWFVSGVFILL